uniref:helix-turn-helix transcriptional regulator n=1 Tax=Halegenticoccus soli TaxID=1985678 RepID=UPI00117B0366|nr:transcriptional regulator [Halegenticoccus soli]
MQRAEFVECLLAGPKFQPELKEELQVSRSTTYKATRELLSHRLIMQADNGYRPTILGRLIFEEYQRLLANIERISSPARLLWPISANLDMTIAALTDSQVILPEHHHPNRPIHEVEKLIREASHLKGIAPVVRPQYVTLFNNQFKMEKLTAELVTETPVLNYLTENYATQFCEPLHSGALTVWEMGEPLPFGLLLVERPTEQMGLVVYEPDGGIRGLVVTGSTDAVEWAQHTWQQYQSQTRRVEPTSLCGDS